MAQTTLTLALFRYANLGGCAGAWLRPHKIVFDHVLVMQQLISSVQPGQRGRR
jgi:hypothetical protein